MTTTTTYRVARGFNTKDKRYEVGDRVTADDLKVPDSDVKWLIGHGCLVATKAKKEEG